MIKNNVIGFINCCISILHKMSWTLLVRVMYILFLQVCCMTSQGVITSVSTPPDLWYSSLESCASLCVRSVSMREDGRVSWPPATTRVRMRLRRLCYPRAPMRMLVEVKPCTLLRVHCEATIGSRWVSSQHHDSWFIVDNLEVKCWSPTRWGAVNTNRHLYAVLARVASICLWANMDVHNRVLSLLHLSSDSFQTEFL